MITPNLVKARRALRTRLEELGVTGSGYRTVFIPTMNADYQPQQPVELTLAIDGLEPRDGDLTGAVDVYLVCRVAVLCSNLLADDDIEVDDVVLIVMHDVIQHLLAEPRLNLPGVVINTLVGDAEINDLTDRGYYGGVISVRLQVRNPL